MRDETSSFAHNLNKWRTFARFNEDTRILLKESQINFSRVYTVDIRFDVINVVDFLCLGQRESRIILVLLSISFA